MDMKLKTPRLIDQFGRTVDYIRLSITDRCDFRCTYCMAEDMTFLPRNEVLSLEECLRIVKVFVRLGVTKVRITGGEPLVRKNALWLFDEIGKLEHLNELVLTTNGSQLENTLPPSKNLVSSASTFLWIALNQKYLKKLLALEI